MSNSWIAAWLGFPVLHYFWGLLKLMSIELVMPSNHLILCHLLLLPPSIFPNIRVFSNETAVRIRWPKDSVAQSCPTLCDPMDYSTPSFPVHHQCLGIAQTHIH